MTYSAVRIRPDTYVDSVILMEASRAMQQAAGVEWAAALMGTPANVDSLVEEGFDRSKLGDVGANDVVLAARLASPDECEEAFAGVDSLFAGKGRSQVTRTEARPRTIEEATSFLSGANVAVISVPGHYAALEAHKALSRGLHVLLFSDNVPLEDELALKSRGGELGLLVMGPGAGTAMLGGVGLGFANVIQRTPGRGGVGIAAAAGTGAQEVMSLLDRWGAGVSHLIGVGGRDVSEAVGGCMMRKAVRALEDDPATDVVVVVSKPPAPQVAKALLEALGGKKRAIAALIGLEDRMATPAGVSLCSTMEEAALGALNALGLPRPDLEAGLTGAGDRRDPLPEGRRVVRGLYSGGTLCYEAMTILSSRLGPVYSNTPLKKDWSLPAPPGSHICLDLGEEEFTKGRPHPMIDPEPRAERLLEEAKEPAVGVLLIDVVLGYGAHPDPASVLAPACAGVTSEPDSPRVVAYVLGTERDPQNYDQQCARLRQAGCMLAPTGAAAARMAAQIVLGAVPADRGA
jgi:FdrA protein